MQRYTDILMSLEKQNKTNTSCFVCLHMVGLQVPGIYANKGRCCNCY